MSAAGRILVVDDEPDVLIYLSCFLEDQGFEVDTASRGQEALTQVRERPPDLISLDVNMPGMSGIEVLTQLRADPELAAIPVVLVTGVAEFRSPTAFRGCRPPEAFIQKPVDLELLLSSVRELLAREAGVT